MPSFPEAAALLAAPAGVLLLLLLAARAGGELFAQRRQPRVVGEILGGLLLGPSGASSKDRKSTRLNSSH